MKTYSLFLGCTIPVRAMNYEISARRILEVLEVPLQEIEEFTCCGYPIESVDDLTALTASAKNLALAEKYSTTILTLCSACTGTLTKAKKTLDENSDLRAKVNENLSVLNLKYTGKAEIKHIGKFLLEDVGPEKIREKVVTPLTGLRIAPHYGCHFNKPSNIFDYFDDTERPSSLKNLVEAVGATYVVYDNLMQCCGGAVLAVDENLSLTLARTKLQNVRAAEADAMTLICPFCYLMYDLNQKRIEKDHDETFKIPVLFLPQLIGLAFGLDPKALGLKMNRVKPKALLKKVEALSAG
jgi:heterodisulfide reductase subunit B